MYQHSTSSGGTPASARLLTTVIAGCWGLSSAYLLFNSLLVTHDTRPCLAALVPLIVVWATLERKRWGRLALLGLSATALGLFAAGLGYVASLGDHWLRPTDRNLAGYVRMALPLFADNPTAAYATLILAVTTGLWLRRPVVIAEFERGKRATLALAQRGIALSLVGCWALALIFTPFAPAVKASSAASASAGHSSRPHAVRLHAAHSRRVSRRNSRSDMPASNL
jgi:hypothetical protein